MRSTYANRHSRLTLPKDLNNAVDLLIKATAPGSYLPLAQFPFLKLIPDRWVPSKQRAVETYRRNTATYEKAREIVTKRREAGDIRESLADHILDGSIQFDIPISRSLLNKGFLGTAHQAAFEMTATAILTDTLLLAKYPKFQIKTREELDKVCGTKRMPHWSDFERLPYINCIIKGLRIRPVVPASIPYCAKENVWYDGMLIPKNATVFVPVYALHHTYYPDPETYNPDRFLDQPKLSVDYVASKNRDHYAFGAGRRVYAGIHLAERTLWRTIAQILWGFNIERAVEENGDKIDLDEDAYTETLSWPPDPFQVRFIPRSEKHAQVMRDASAEAEEYLGQGE